jgi:hypothetical protein
LNLEQQQQEKQQQASGKDKEGKDGSWAGVKLQQAGGVRREGSAVVSAPDNGRMSRLN